jgi:drug/metabolite transporter (DMT)-like permease
VPAEALRSKRAVDVDVDVDQDVTRTHLHAAHRRGLALVGLAALIWSSGGVIVRSLETEDSWATIAYRSLFASLFVIVFVRLRARRELAVGVGAPGVAPPRSGWGWAWRWVRSIGRPGLVVGVCFAISSISLVVALGLTSVANTLVVMSTTPIAAALLGRIVLGEPVRWRTWVAAGATVVGVVVMVGGSAGGGSRVGDAVAALMPLSMAVATVVIRRHRQVAMVPAVAVGTVLALLVSLPFVESFAVSPRDFALLVVFGAGQLGLGLALYALGARDAPPADVALVSLLEPVLGPLWVWLVIGERAAGGALVGGLIVLTAMVWHTALDLRGRTAPPLA